MTDPGINETRGDRAADPLPHTAFSRAVDRFQLALGGVLSWLWLALLFVIVLNVVLRYAFGEGRVELEELQWHLFAVGFLSALALAVTTDDHVRVDVIHERLPLRWRAWIEFYGTLLLLGPFLALILIHSVPFVISAWQTGEVSQAPGGLPFRWLIKAMLPLSFLLLAAAVLARLTRVCALLFGVPAALAPDAAPESPTASGQSTSSRQAGH